MEPNSVPTNRDIKNGNGNGHPVEPQTAKPADNIAPTPTTQPSIPITPSPATTSGASSEPITVVPEKAPLMLRSRGKFVKGCCPNPKGRPKGSLNRNTQLLLEIKKFVVEDAKGRKVSFERALLAIALKQAEAGNPMLAVEILKRIYVTLTPESAGINIVNNATAASYEAAISQLHAERSVATSRLSGEDISG